jgi:hypothetical protein
MVVHRISLVTSKGLRSMPRPKKYATAREAAHNNLYSKMAGQNLGLSLEQFMYVATGKCELCGQPPLEVLVVDRKDGRHELAWHYVIRTESGYICLCRMCKTLAQSFKMKDIISHCARIMARRMWKVHTRWTDLLFQGQDKPLVPRSDSDPTSGMGKDITP